MNIVYMVVLSAFAVIGIACVIVLLLDKLVMSCGGIEEMRICIKLSGDSPVLSCCVKSIICDLERIHTCSGNCRIELIDAGLSEVNADEIRQLCKNDSISLIPQNM